MNFKEYETHVADTAIYPRDYGIIGKTYVDLAVLYTAMGLVSEAGEVADKLKKAIRDSKGKYRPDELAKELGDCLYYVAALANALGFSIEDIAEMNVEKLASRKARNVIKGSGDNR